MADEPDEPTKDEEPKPASASTAPAGSTGDLVEDAEPQPGLAGFNEWGIVETVPVPRGIPEILRKRPPKDPDHNVRTGLAWALTLLLVALAVIAALGWLFGHKKLEDLQAYLLVMSPIVTLTGTILGFYFSTGRNRAKN